MSKEKDNIRVDIYDQYRAEKYLRKFKKMCESFGIVREYRKRQSYQKPSDAMREKKKSADKRRRKNILKQDQYLNGKI